MFAQSQTKVLVFTMKIYSSFFSISVKNKPVTLGLKVGLLSFSQFLFMNVENAAFYYLHGYTYTLIIQLVVFDLLPLTSNVFQLSKEQELFTQWEDNEVSNKCFVLKPCSY